MNRQDNEGVSEFIARARAAKVLERDEETALVYEAQKGDAKAMARLVESNLRAVVALSLRFRRYGIRLSDLISEGNLGLMTAVHKFDPGRGTRLATYASYWIRAYLLDFVVRSTTMVGAGSGPLRTKWFFRLRRERARLQASVTDPRERLEKLAERFGFDVDKMEHFLHRLDSRDVYLDAPLSANGEGSMVDHLPSGELSQDVAYDQEERQAALGDVVAKAMDSLDQRERFIIEQRIMHDDESSLATIGRRLGLSRERVRQLESRAKDKLREQLQAYSQIVLAVA